MGKVPHRHPELLAPDFRERVAAVVVAVVQGLAQLFK
jgi:hypothetical protein